MSDNYIFVSESVTAGHPDKLCDQISDALVDDYLAQDASARVDAECAIANGIVFIGAHYACDGSIDVAETARRVIGAVGYDEGEFNAQDCTILTSLTEVEGLMRLNGATGDGDLTDKLVAQHQATVFGYACRQTETLMPLPIQLAHALARRLDEARRDGVLDYLKPDGKTQVAVEYADRQPVRLHAVSIVTSADPAAISQPAVLRDDLVEAVIGPALSDQPLQLDNSTRVLINHDGVIRAGGPALHSGLTGRKTAVDTYGEFARHSGAALSGKDALRVDRGGAYAARHVAKNIVAAGLAEECEVQISYSIGLAEPVSVHTETFGTGKLPPVELRSRVEQNFSLTPAGIINSFGLRSAGSFRKLATYGHVGRADLELPWEMTDRVDALS